MEGKAKILSLCLLVALLCYFSTAKLLIMRPQIKSRNIFRKRSYRKPTIRMRSITLKKQLKLLSPIDETMKKLQLLMRSPTSDETTPLPVLDLNPVKPHSSGLPYSRPRDVNVVLTGERKEHGRSKMTSPPTDETTPRPVLNLNPVKPHSSGLPYCRPRDVNAVLTGERKEHGRSKRAVSFN